ncbi:MAG: hypothetical protein JW754_01290 [Candidatus Aenigmarchaeota archaeon]|nr:hypothetical protein [Candidatus Aenigmarchaeota archaeon]
MMKFEIKEQKSNPLLKRDEVEVIVDHAGSSTPSRMEIMDAASKELKVNKDLVLVDKIFSIKGKGTSKVKFLVYKKKEDVPKEKLEGIEKRLEKVRKKAKAAATEEKPAEAGEEAKPEEKREAPKEEAKPPKTEEKPAEEKGE